jgi:hypothetical protein
MVNGNLGVILMVVAVVTCVLGIIYAALYCLDRTVDPR